jgi:hypothetical protein
MADAYVLTLSTIMLMIVYAVNLNRFSCKHLQGFTSNQMNLSALLKSHIEGVRIENIRVSSHL